MPDERASTEAFITWRCRQGMAKEKGVEFILPTDVIVADKFAPDAESKTVPIDAIPEGWMVRARGCPRCMPGRAPLQRAPEYSRLQGGMRATLSPGQLTEHPGMHICLPRICACTGCLGGAPCTVTKWALMWVTSGHMPMCTCWPHAGRATHAACVLWGAHLLDIQPLGRRPGRAHGLRSCDAL